MWDSILLLLLHCIEVCRCYFSRVKSHFHCSFRALRHPCSLLLSKRHLENANDAIVCLSPAAVPSHSVRQFSEGRRGRFSMLGLPRENVDASCLVKAKRHNFYCFLSALRHLLLSKQHLENANAAIVCLSPAAVPSHSVRQFLERSSQLVFHARVAP